MSIFSSFRNFLPLVISSIFTINAQAFDMVLAQACEESAISQWAKHSGLTLAELEKVGYIGIAQNQSYKDMYNLDLVVIGEGVAAVQYCGYLSKIDRTFLSGNISEVLDMQRQYN